MDKNSQVQLDVSAFHTGQVTCQILSINLLKPGNLFLPYESVKNDSFLTRIKASELETLELPEQLKLDQGIILYGQAPIWLYARLANLCKQAPWIASYDLRSGSAVITSSSVTDYPVGTSLPLPGREPLGMAIAIGGPPDSGKSILSNALRSTLSRFYPEITLFIHRANWDGEGNWSYETQDRQIVEKLIQRGEYKIHKLSNSDALIQNYFQYHAQATENVRKIIDLTFVDLGGVPQEQKQPVIEQCTHYIVISSKPEKVQEWHDFFGKTLQPLAVLHTKAAATFMPSSDVPYLDLALDLRDLIKTQRISGTLLNAIIRAWEEYQSSDAKLM